VRPVITDSARKHGVADEDLLHALRNYVDLFGLDEGLTMVIGPAYDGRLPEVGVVDSDDDQVVVHAMPARERCLRGR
jgi:hypothetical protein